MSMVRRCDHCGEDIIPSPPTEVADKRVEVTCYDSNLRPVHPPGVADYHAECWTVVFEEVSLKFFNRELSRIQLDWTANY